MKKEKVVITDDNYKIFMLKRAIKLCWLILAWCFAVKVFGGNFFNIICENDSFVKICEWLDRSELYYVISYLFYIINCMIIVFAITSKYRFSFNQTSLMIIAITICWVVKYKNLTIGMILDILIVEFIVPFIILLRQKYHKKEVIYRLIIGCVLINLFQLISIFVRNLGIFKILNENTLISLIMQIDYYIMLILYLLYSIKITRKEI